MTDQGVQTGIALGLERFRFVVDRDDFVICHPEAAAEGSPICATKRRDASLRSA
jgi:hypothetical protein